jgi:oligosaccharide reducing-end xylanase
VIAVRPASASRAQLAAILAVGMLLSGCTTTVDSLGYDEADAAPAPVGLRPLVRPTTYPNPFRDVLGKSQADIDMKINAAFQQLFHGDPANEAVYFSVNDDQALIRDILHNDERTEGVGLGMLLCVELDRRDEFNDLWRYAKSELGATGANTGYYASRCNNVDGLTTVECIDPYGMQQFAMALVFAHGRWKSAGAIDYEADALELLDVMRHMEDRNGGMVDDVTNVFDQETKLVPHEPKGSASMFTRPSIEIPAYYELWAQATGDAFWSQAADAGRAYLRLVPNATTALTPVRAYLSTGLPVTGAGWDAFRPEAYRTHVNLALDGIWFRGDPWVVETSDRLLGFFWEQGIATYGTSYTLDGMVLDPAHEIALVAANGAAATVATRSERTGFIQAAWDLETPVGPARYYPGLLDLVALLLLSGRFQVY